jgi:hypothetical protein
MATSATAAGLRVIAAIRRMAASPWHLHDFVEQRVTMNAVKVSSTNRVNDL